MMNFIRCLEGQSNSQRREVILREISRRGWNYWIQTYTYSEQDGANIVIDFQTGPSTDGKFLLLGAHYDVFAGSPGANDDASAIAVLINTAEKLADRRLPWNLRFVFFDDEEPTVWWRFPVGSTMYVQEQGTQNLAGMIDLELCGIGDSIAFWPVEGIEHGRFLQLLIEECRDQQISYDVAKRIPSFYADYQPFRVAGFENAICLTAFPWSERKKLLQFAAAGYAGLLLRYLGWRFFRFRSVPTVFQHYHNKADRSEFLSEEMLQKMSDLVVGIVGRLGISRFGV